ncbi:MAG: hypothetical protein WD801_15945, partial [Gemmatimonadaceae bacterium]
MSALRRLLVLPLILLPATAFSQKKVLTQADWDTWKSISGAALTPDGQWAVYSISPLVGDGGLVIRATSSSTEYRVPRGFLGRANNTPGGLRPRAGGNPEAEPAGPTVAPAQLTHDSRHVLALTYPTQAQFARAGRGRGASAVTSRTDLAIVRLADGNVTTLERVRSFRLPRSSGAWVAYAPADSAPPAAAVPQRGEGIGAPAG